MISKAVGLKSVKNIHACKWDRDKWKNQSILDILLENTLKHYWKANRRFDLI